MICWFENHINNVESIDSFVFFTSCISSRHSGYYIHEANFRQNIAVYVAKGRNVLGKTWKNQSDVYFVPKVKL
jgi:hypothetical protein